ncbi:hypothetical protein KHA94_15625 [Bacillus sp. FJAT-49705]|uniref:Uncharacterized protein n=1 Tax=Cytobacillus citreus TaxID=2833586 RepID=A0ABS5NUW2_9BACI|nr:hypothetical protein [Cytobacillus citreus]MBS4191619.1 hypothetical protein [Cytobacillus citreus]
MNEHFLYDERLGIPIPSFKVDWDQFSKKIQQSILFQWEKIRGTIPDRITELEKKINVKQDQLSDEENFIKSCELNSQISELASIINDLWLWYRTNQDISEKVHM